MEIFKISKLNDADLATSININHIIWFSEAHIGEGHGLKNISILWD